MAWLWDRGHVKCQRADDSDDVRRKLSLELLWLMELVLS